MTSKNTESDLIESLNYPVAVQHRSMEDLSWNTIRAEGTCIDDEKNYVILHPPKGVEWGSLLLIILNFPNVKIWNMVVYLSILITYHTGTSCYIFLQKELKHFIPSYIVCDVIYLIDFIILLLHKYWKKLRTSTTIHVKSTHLVFLIIDGITFLPQELLVWVILGPTHPMIYYCRFITCLRLHRFFMFKEIFGSIKVYRRVYFIAQYCIVFLLVLHLAVCITFVLACDDPNCKTGHYWSNTNKIYENIAKNVPTKYLLCIYVCFTLMGNVGFGDFYGMIFEEYLFFSFLMLIGFLLTTGVLIAMLAVQLINDSERRIKFSRNLINANRFLKQIGASNSLKAQLLGYYKVLWTHKNGVKYAENFETLPKSLQMELTYDINIIHLQNSLLFKNLPESILRKISLLMKNQFLLPGDVIFYQGVVKYCILFIASGVLEILSDEDDNSPIISFKAGTVLGEVASFVHIPSKATVRAVTYTELQVINRTDLMKMILNYRPDAKKLLKEIKTRINFAKKRQIYSNKDRVIINLLVSKMKEFRPIKLLKERLSGKNKESLYITVDQYQDLYDSVRASAHGKMHESDGFSEKCLSLYRYSRHVTTIEAPFVFLTSKFPWILDPDSSPVTVWNYALFIIAMINCILYPYYVSFERTFPRYLTLFATVTDTIYGTNLFIQCGTAVKMKNKVLKKYWSILKYRMNCWTFYIDIFSVFPLEVYINTFDNQVLIDRFYSLFQMNRLLRIWRLHNFFSGLKKNLYGNLITINVFKYTVYLILLTYWFACLLYLETCLYITCTEGGWFLVNIQTAVDKHDDSPCYINPLAISWYLSTMVFFRVGYGDIYPTNEWDMVLIVVMILMGALILATCIAEFCALFTLHEQNRKQYQYIMFSLERVLKENNVSLALRQRVMNFLYLQWYYNRGTTREKLLKTTPPYLRSSIESTELLEALKNSPIFQELDIDFLMIIASGTKAQVLPSNEVIYYSGDISREMYILQKGYCEIFLTDGTSIQKGVPGCQLGVLEMIYGIPKHYTVRTVTNCKVISIDYRTYMRAMSMFPSILEETRKVMSESDLFEWVTQVDIERERKLKFIKPPTEKKNIWLYLGNIRNCLGKSFICTWKKCKASGGRDDYWEPFHKMGKFSLLGFLLLPITINPQGYFIKFWCTFRHTLILILSIILPYYISVSPYAEVLYWFILFIDITSYLEIYLLLHVGYYNEEGILITHPKYTAKHYLTHNFILDLIASFPIRPFIKIKNNFHLWEHDIRTHLLSEHTKHSVWNIKSLLLLHNFPKAFNYLEKNIMHRRNYYKLFKLLISIIIFTNLATCLVFKLQCDYEFSENRKNDTSEIIAHDENITYYGYMECSAGSWLKQSQFHNVTNPLMIYIFGFYWVTTTLTAVGLGDIVAQNLSSVNIVIITIFLGFIILSYTVAIVVSGRAEFSTVLTSYQDSIINLRAFMKKQKVNAELQNKIFNYYKYVWQRTCGFEPQILIQRLNTALIEDTVLFLYEKTLREVPLFENVERSFLRVIATHLSEQYFLKGDTVVRSYDVHSNIYIIYRGKVEVLSKFNEMIACMGPGGIFGNIRQVGVGCSSVTITANRDLDVLVISSEKFYTVMKDYPRVKRVMESLLETVTDYIIPSTLIGDDILDALSKDSSEEINSSSSVNIRKYSPTRRSLHSANTSIPSEFSKDYFLSGFTKGLLYLSLPNKWFKFALRPDHGVFQISSYLIFLTTCLNVLTITYTFITQDKNFIFLLCLILEPIFLINIFLTLHKAYMDRYGNYVTAFHRIAHNYLKNREKVFWDIFPNIPIELICFAFSKNKFRTFSYLRMFHLLRIRYLFDFFKEKRTNLFTKRIINQLLQLFLWLFMTIHILSCIWYFIACPFGECKEKTWIDALKSKDDDKFETYCFSLYYIVSLATVTGIGDIKPKTIWETIFTIIIMITWKFLTALMIGDIMTMLNISTTGMINYEYRIKCLQDFLQNQNLSGHQLEKLWAYVRLLWSEERGQHMPKLIKIAPYVMHCDIMTDIYGQHLRGSILFNGINEALLRQLAARLDRTVFFAGNYIVQHGDTDQNMYFIHTGEVSVLTVHPNLTETRHELLRSQDMFGLAQGLFNGFPHHFSFRAETKVEILALHLNSWSDMMRFFPKEKEIIYARARTLYTTL